MNDVLSGRKLIVVSNRLPVTVSKKKGKLKYTNSSGGLATAMSSLGIDKSQMSWVGWPGIASDDLTDKETKEITKHLKGEGFYPVFLSNDQIDKFYSGYANDTVWPLFHYFQSYTQHDSDYWDSYVEVNNIYKSAVSEVADEDTYIWVHDYHLMLLPQLLRDSLPDSSIGFFLHIPFPSYEVFRQLPNGSSLLKGMLGADLIGFHIYDFVRHFLSSVLRSIEADNMHGLITSQGRSIKTDAFPIGIDFKKFSNKPIDEKSVQYVSELAQHYKGQKVILSVDRLDYSKGIEKRLEAYEQLLKNNPKLHKKITLIVLAVPSRSDVITYKELRDSIELTISRINGMYSSVDWTPIHYQFKNIPQEEVVSLYRIADVALVTPLRDGMNLVAKEFVAANHDSSEGVLILSEMAGAIDELHGAIKVNPNDINAIEDSIKIALAMSKKEQKSRIKEMNKRLSKYTVQKWGHDFLEQLADVKKSQQQKGKNLINEKRIVDIAKAYTDAKKRIIFLDYDGTLVSLQQNYNSPKVKPTKKLLNLLSGLANQANTELYVISGRPHKKLERWLGSIKNINLVAEHGGWAKENGDWNKSEVSISRHKKKILNILNKFTERTPGAEVEEKTTSIVWHYRKVPAELAYIRKIDLLRELNEAIDHNSLMIHQGSKVIEIKSSIVDKGRIVKKAISNHPSDFILCVGDDYTDEDMFNVLPADAFSVKVGSNETSAKYWVKDVDSVIGLLERLTEKT